MASKIAPAFTGPLYAPALLQWIAAVEDGFAIYHATKPEKASDLTEQMKIRIAGTLLHEPTTQAWWNLGRDEMLKLETFEGFTTKLKKRFIPKAQKLLALRDFFLCTQGTSHFAEYAAALADARTAAGDKDIDAKTYKYHLLFHSHPHLLLRIMALPDLNLDNLSFDDLVSLMTLTWDSLTAEKMPVRTPRTAASISTPAPSPALPRTVGNLAPLTDAERDHISANGGCWRCRKLPSDPGWTKHVGRTCPGDPSRGITPGRDYVLPVKRELAAGAMMYSGGFDEGGEDQPGSPEPEEEEWPHDVNTSDESDG
jgi:hypothetical protein